MDQNYLQQGDLTDILRATNNNISSSGSGGGASSSASTTTQAAEPDSEFALFNNLIKYQSSEATQELAADDFGDPFSHMQDPLLLNNELINSGSPGFFFDNSSSSAGIAAPVDLDHEQHDHDIEAGGDDDHDQMMIMMRQQRPSSSSCDVFSRMLRISPTTTSSSTVANIKTPPAMTTNTSLAAVRPFSPPRETSLINISNNNVIGLPQILPSPRNPAIKRRKSQAKKVVCIPAPAPVNSRPSGEIVPSDLWAWRKYGQKPIKGSPYPRGYYRCSSSKGCLARKQVERSRTDPNMLVITYTSEHNHPWPTQRNALAGSTRAQPSKSNAHKSNDLSEDLRDNVDASLLSTTNNAYVKDEMKDLDMDEGFSPSYKPTMPDSNLNNPNETFFDELDEIEADPIRLLLNQGHEEGDRNKGLNPFTVFDWSGDNKRCL